MDPIKPENNNNNNNNTDDDDDNDDEFDYYRTMHPLNNLKLKPPKSILSVSFNQVITKITISAIRPFIK